MTVEEALTEFIHETVRRGYSYESSSYLTELIQDDGVWRVLIGSQEFLDLYALRCSAGRGFTGKPCRRIHFGDKLVATVLADSV